MKVFESAVIFVVAMVMGLDIVSGCSCEVRHPQTHFCDADFVMLARVQGEGEMIYRKTEHDSPIPGGKPLVRRDPIEIKYSVRVKKLFKVKDNDFGLSKNTTVTEVYTAPEGSVCGISLSPRAKVLLSGFFSHGKPTVTLCGWNTPWPWVSKIQKKGLRYLYRENCGCEVIKSSYRQGRGSTSTVNNNYCFWGQGYDSDCYLRQSACVPDKNSSTGGCKWRRNNKLKMCRKDAKSPRREP